MAIDFTSAVGKIRLKTSDLGDPPIVDDAVLQGYLGLYQWNPSTPNSFTDQMVWRASADVLDAMATTESLLSKKLTTQDLSTDGPAVAADLRKRAAQLRSEADAQDVADAGQDVFTIVPMGGYRRPEAAERYW